MLLTHRQDNEGQVKKLNWVKQSKVQLKHMYPPWDYKAQQTFSKKHATLSHAARGTAHTRGESLSSFMNTVMLRKVSLGFSLGMNIPSN